MADCNPGSEWGTSQGGPRQVAARLAVVQALGEMTSSAPISEISVVSLCRRVGISRTTFYEYFANVQDVAIWAWDHLMSSTLYRMGELYGCYEAHLRKFEALAEHRQFFARALEPVGYHSTLQHAGRYMNDHLRRVIERKRGTPLTEEEGLELDFFIQGASYMTRLWAEDHMERDPKMMARVFARAVPAFAAPYLDPDPAEGELPCS